MTDIRKLAEDVLAKAEKATPMPNMEWNYTSHDNDYFGGWVESPEVKCETFHEMERQIRDDRIYLETIANAAPQLAQAVIEMSEHIAYHAQDEGMLRVADDQDVEIQMLKARLAAAEKLAEACGDPALKTTFDLLEQHKGTWRDKPEDYWLARLMQEVGELASSLVGDHDDPVEWELSQIAAICMNWLRYRLAIAAWKEASK